MSFDGIKACELEMKPAWDNPSDTSKESNGFERPSAATNPSPFIQKKEACRGTLRTRPKREPARHIVASDFWSHLGSN